MVNILVVEDDDNLRRLMHDYLIQNSYQVFGTDDGLKALEIIGAVHIDLMICDIMMPNMDGYELTEVLRKTNFEMPILMITAKESLEDKKKGFLAGTDDYMVKPVDLDEMLLRIKAILRRAHIANERKLVVGDVTLDYDKLTLSTDQLLIELPKKEFYLLFKLLSYPKQIFTRQQLMDEIWGMDVESDVRTVDVHIKRLREKLIEIKDFNIVTVRGLGYKAEKTV